MQTVIDKMGCLNSELQGQSDHGKNYKFPFKIKKSWHKIFWHTLYMLRADNILGRIGMIDYACVQFVIQPKLLMHCLRKSPIVTGFCDMVQFVSFF